MASKRDGSKDTVERITRDMVEQVSMSLPVYTDTHLFIEKTSRSHGKTSTLYSQTALRRIWRTDRSMSIFISHDCTRFHAGIPPSHAQM